MAGTSTPKGAKHPGMNIGMTANVCRRCGDVFPEKCITIELRQLHPRHGRAKGDVCLGCFAEVLLEDEKASEKILSALAKKLLERADAGPSETQARVLTEESPDAGTPE